jgi:serine/threonine-protein kinase
MPDGRHVTFAASTAGPDNIFSQAADGSASAERLTTSGTIHMPASWSPNGKTLLFVESLPGTGSSGKLHIRDANGEVRALHETRAIEIEPDFSPDGRWIAYVSDESGRDEVYVRAYPGGGPSRPVSNGGGRAPGWSRDGRELFYLVLQDLAPGGSTPTQMMSVPVTTENGFTAGLPRRLFAGKFTLQTMVRGWDVAPGGNRFLMVVGKDRPAVRADQMILVQNWFDELRRRVPTP